jgi:DNA primase
VETAPADIALASTLAHEVLGRSLDELPPGTRRLLDAISGYVTRRCEEEGLDADLVRFTRRQLRETLGLGDTQLKVHLARLADLELVIVHRMESGGFCYELAWQPGPDATGGRVLPGLIDPASLLDTAVTDGRPGSEGSWPGPGRPPAGGRTAPGRAAPVTVNGQASGHMRAAGNGGHAAVTDPAQGNGRVIAAAGGSR